MKTIIINENRLFDSDIELTNNKVRAVLVDNDKLLIANYGGVYLLPGGKIENKETHEQALIRELREETGIYYSEKDLEELFTLKYYQKDYPVKGYDIKNKLSITNFYLGNFKGIDSYNLNRSAKEIRDGFCLQLVNIDDIDLLIKEIPYNHNPRKIFFDRELEEVKKVLIKSL